MSNTITFKTKFGWMSAVEENNNVISISFGKKKKIGISKNLNECKKSIIEYLLGKNKNLKFPAKINGSYLQKKIWSEMRKIPYGETRSYGEIASKLNTSPRYVGKVCGQNKHLLLIPCHRVTRSDGQLGGFSALGGIKLKKCLIDLELLNKKLSK